MMCSTTKAALSGLWILGFTTCCLSWPTATKSRNAYSYDNDYAMPLMMGQEAYAAAAAENQWDIAQDPQDPYEYDPEALDYFEQPQQQQQSQHSNQKYLPLNPEIIEALANIVYDTNKDENVWGQIVRERPETELEELKQLSSGSHGKAGASFEKRGSAPATTTTSSPPIKIKATPVPVAKTLQAKSNMVPSHHGQKEFPLLRPPTQPKALETSSDPVITQRSLGSDKKPSPYDTLRKYLSIEDALKKEAEKRTAAKQATSRQVKRSSSLVADAESLTSQLNKLKPTAS